VPEPRPPEPSAKAAAPPWGAAWGWVAVAFAVGFANYPLQVVGTALDHLPGDVIDNRLNNFVLEHGYRWLRGDEPSFWDAPSFYPRANVTALSDAHVGMLPCYAALRAVGASPEGAFQGHFVAATVLNFVAAAWALRRIGFGPAGVAAGAYLFAFSLPVVAQTQHTQLLPRFFAPVAVVFAWEFLRDRRTAKFAAAAAAVAGQVYVSVYLGYFLALVLGAGFLAAVVRFPLAVARTWAAPAGWRAWLAWAAVPVVAAAAVAPLVERHRRASAGGTAAEHIRAGAPLPASWLTPPDTSYFHTSHPWSPVPRFDLPEGEHLMFPGVLPIVAVGIVSVLGFRPTAIGTPRGAAVVAAWAAVALAALVTRFGDVWPYQLLCALPGVGGIRVPGRVCLLLPLLSGIAVAYLLDAMVGAARRFGRGAAALVAAACLAAVFADQRLVPTDGNRAAWYDFRTPTAAVLARQERIAGAVRGDPGVGFVYAFPALAARDDGLRPERELLALQVEAMRATQDLGVPCVNGWTGYAPAGWHFFGNYRELATWVTAANGHPSDRLHGLTVVGEPGEPHAGDAEFEAFMRQTFPPRPAAR
jgi:hypothetical protein